MHPITQFQKLIYLNFLQFIFIHLHISTELQPSTYLYLPKQPHVFREEEQNRQILGCSQSAADKVPSQVAWQRFFVVMQQ